MIFTRVTYSIFIFLLACLLAKAQEIEPAQKTMVSYDNAFQLAYNGETEAAKRILLDLVSKTPDDLDARSLLASTYSWNGDYTRARDEFNLITSKRRDHKNAWISSIKNELYTKNYATALGLANKALKYLDGNSEIERLRTIALEGIEHQEFTENGWFDDQAIAVDQNNQEKENRIGRKMEKVDESVDTTEVKTVVKPKTPLDEEVLKNRFGIRNSFTVFDQRYDPMVYSNIAFKHQTKWGSIIPAINYSNRLGQQGLQYDVSLYPKLARKVYAYLNYGYSNAPIYPAHKMAGDIYVNLPKGIELSGGGRYIKFESRDVRVVTNSLGYYTGNYYFSLRSYITPRPDNLTRFSGNLLVRKYLRDGENYIGGTVGMGYSPELRQLRSGDELLAETLLYIESQRLGIEYQFTGKNAPNIYKANIGVARQELSYDSGNFFWAVSAGLTYQVKF